MHFSKSSRVFIGASALTLVASLAVAQDPAPFPECTKAPNADDVEAAKQSHIIATSRFNLQDWDKAIEFWRQAYGLDCTAHKILVNIANAYEKKGDKKNAIMALETYLVRAKDAPDLVQVNERVIELKRSLEPTPTATASATATAVVTATATATTTAPPPGGPRAFGNTPLYVAGAGGVVALVGAILIPVGLGPYGDAQNKCPGAECTKEIADGGNSGRATWNAGAALLGIGAAAAAGGLVWHFVFNPPKATTAPAQPGAPPPKARVEVAPALGPQFGGVLIHGKF